MKIALFTDVYYPYISGVVTVVERQAKALRRRGHQVSIFSPCYKTGNDNVVRLPLSFPIPRPKGFRATIPALTSIRDLRDTDIVHIHTEGGVGWEGLLSGKILGLSVVSTIHTLCDESLLKGMGIKNTDRWGALAWKIALMLHNRVDLTICPSETIRKRATENGLKSRTRLVSNGMMVGEEIERPERKKPRIIYVGRVSPEKDIRIALKAFQELRERVECEFLVVGDGPSLDELRVWAKDVQDVVFKGRISHDDLLNGDLYKESDIFFSASGSENQPVTFLEAMSFSLPLVGVRRNGAEELIKKNGLLSEPGDYLGLANSLEYLVRDFGLRTRMGQESYKALRDKHEISNVVKKLEGVYKELLSDSMKGKHD